MDDPGDMIKGQRSSTSSLHDGNTTTAAAATATAAADQDSCDDRDLYSSIRETLEDLYRQAKQSSPRVQSHLAVSSRARRCCKSAGETVSSELLRVKIEFLG